MQSEESRWERDSSRTAAPERVTARVATRDSAAAGGHQGAARTLRGLRAVERAPAGDATVQLFTCGTCGGTGRQRAPSGRLYLCTGCSGAGRIVREVGAAPLVAGGQGRSDEQLEDEGRGVLIWAVAVVGGAVVLGAIELVSGWMGWA